MGTDEDAQYLKQMQLMRRDANTANFNAEQAIVEIIKAACAELKTEAIAVQRETLLLNIYTASTIAEAHAEKSRLAREAAEQKRLANIEAFKTQKQIQGPSRIAT